ncbi:MAG: hypothetical protein ACI4KA_05645 [Oscillospiraceae bacterium]
MKKKLLCALLASSLLLGMTACGEKDESSNTAEAGENASSAGDAAEGDNAAAAGSGNEADKTTNKIVADKVVLGLEFNNTLIISADDKQYVYNAGENRLYDTSVITEARDDHFVYAGDKLGRTYGKNDGDKITPKYYNLETGELIGRAFNPPAVGEFNPVYTYEETADGRVYSFGVINSNCEWLVPMSSEYSICQYDLLNCSMVKGSKNVFWFVPDKDTSDKDLYYNVLTDQFVDLPTESYGVSGNKVIYVCDRKLYMLDMQTNEITEPYPDLQCTDMEQSGDGFYVDVYDSDEDLFLDSDLNQIHFDLSGFDEIYPQIFNENYLVFTLLDIKGDSCYAVMDNDGNCIIEPTVTDTWRDSVKLWGDYFIFESYDNPSYICNLKTGEITENNYSKFFKETGQVLIYKDGAYYLATIDNPDEMVKAFEIIR